MPKNEEIMNSDDIRNKFLEFYKSKQHKEIQSVPLITQEDSTLLFVNSGMFPLVPYLLGEDHPQGTRLCNYQRSFRTDDIQEVGDQRHTTFFEMLGNWSLGDYFKAEQLNFWYDFLIQVIGLDPNRLYQSVFAGDDRAPKDNETIEILKGIYDRYGVSAGVGVDTLTDGTKGPGVEIDFAAQRIFPYRDKNWWQRGDAIGEVGGPDSETFYDTGKPHDPKFGPHCHVNCDCGRFIEIGNSVFIQYVLEASGWTQLDRKNVDFGGGLERLTMVVNKKDNVFETDLFAPYIQLLSQKGCEYNQENAKSIEIILDHTRAATFLIMDGGLPSNKDQGYFIRRLIRRVLAQMHKLDIEFDFIQDLTQAVIQRMQSIYPQLADKAEHIIDTIVAEKDMFSKTLNKGITTFEKMIKNKDTLSGEDVFTLQATYGFPVEMVIEFAQEKNINVDMDGYEQKVQEHKELSKAGADKKFKSGLADSSETTTRYHTATHLLHKVLRDVLGTHVEQKGSNITADRLRFDFSHTEKMSDEQIAQVQNILNDIINNGFTVQKDEMTVKEALDSGAIGLFADRYEGRVNVYAILDKAGNLITKEICNGPHVTDSTDFPNIKIVKEQSAGAGIRRIKAKFES